MNRKLPSSIGRNAVRTPRKNQSEGGAEWRILVPWRAVVGGSAGEPCLLCLCVFVRVVLCERAVNGEGGGGGWEGGPATHPAIHLPGRPTLGDLPWRPSLATHPCEQAWRHPLP